MAIREPFEPESVKDWALIIHADSSGERVDVYWVDVNAGRIGLRLADQVRQWRRRDDLLTIGRRLRIAAPETVGIIEEPITPNQRGYPGSGGSPAAIEPPSPVEPPTTPVEPSGGDRLASRRTYVIGRVRAILEHSETAKQALARAWPEGVPGLKREGQSWDDLDAIIDAVKVVETNHNLPFYPEWNDPERELSKLSHPSNVWGNPRESKPSSVDKENILSGLLTHNRSALIKRWIASAINGGVTSELDTTAIAHALYEFASFDETEWPDDDLTTMLDGSLRALGYEGGCDDLGKFNPDHAPLLMSAAFAISVGNAFLLFDDSGKPVVRTNVKTTDRGQ